MLLHNNCQKKNNEDLSHMVLKIKRFMNKNHLSIKE